MKIKLSKSQWEEMGKKAGWVKEKFIVSNIDANDPSFKEKIEEAYFHGWESKEEYRKGEWTILNPDIKKYTTGRAWWRGWNDSSPYKPKEIPNDLTEFVLSDSEIKF